MPRDPGLRTRLMEEAQLRVDREANPLPDGLMLIGSFSREERNQAIESFRQRRQAELENWWGLEQWQPNWQRPVSPPPRTSWRPEPVQRFEQPSRSSADRDRERAAARQREAQRQQQLREQDRHDARSTANRVNDLLGNRSGASPSREVSDPPAWGRGPASSREPAGWGRGRAPLDALDRRGGEEAGSAPGRVPLDVFDSRRPRERSPLDRFDDR